MIKFKTLRYKNFLSAGNAGIELQLDKDPLTLVVGKNGAGKSSMLCALCFALYGKAYRDITKPLLVNSINEKECEVEVQFSIGETEYRVLRGIKPNVFEIYVNDKLINQDASVRDYQQHLEENVLKMNFRSFTQIVVLGSASFVPFMRLPAAARRDIVEDLLDIKIFTEMNGLLKNKLAAAKEAEMVGNSEFQVAKQKAILQHKYIQTLQEDQQKKQEDIQTKLDPLLAAFEELTLALEEKANEKKAYKTLSADMSRTVNQRMETVNNIAGIRGRVAALEEEIVFHKNNKECPTCKQAIDASVQKKTVGDLREEIAYFEKAIEEQEGLLETLDEKIKELKEKQKQLEKLEKEYLTLTTASIRSKAAIDALKEEAKRKQSYDIQAEKKTLTGLAKDVVEQEKKMTALHEDVSYLNMAAILLKDSGIKTRIIRQYIPVINKTVNKFLQAMDLFVHFELDEQFQETVKSRHRDKFSYESFSEGQKRRIDLALILTWRAIAKLRNNATTNLLIFDEIFDSSLDGDGIDYLISLLNILAEGANIWVISPKGDQLYDRFDNTIRFIEKNNFSTIAK